MYAHSIALLQSVRCALHFLRGSRKHDQELAASKRQLSELREAKDEEAGRAEFEIKKLKADLDIANQKIKVRHAYV